MTQEISSILLDWYREHARDLPWRRMPQPKSSTRTATSGKSPSRQPHSRQSPLPDQAAPCSGSAFVPPIASDLNLSSPTSSDLQLLTPHHPNPHLPDLHLPDPHLPNPYLVWLSEIMLQQTTVAAVKPYFAKFTEKWPSVEALAAAPEEEVMAAWAGLGYYSRARNLIKTARIVAEMGAFPSDEAALKKLPGIGDYTAAAIAAFAFGRRAVVVDANVERVMARLFAIGEPLPAARRAIRRCMDAVTPDGGAGNESAGDFAQAVMDLASSICTPRRPKCDLCPLVHLCAAKAEADAEPGVDGEADSGTDSGTDSGGVRGGEVGPAKYPIKAAKKPKPERKGQAYCILRPGSGAKEADEEGQIWLVTRPPGGMLGAMRGLPDDGWWARGDGTSEPPFSADWTHLGGVRHVFTHFALDLSVMGVEVPCQDTDCVDRPNGNFALGIDGGCGGEAGARAEENVGGLAGQWWPLNIIEDAGLPTLFVKAARLAKAQRMKKDNFGADVEDGSS